MKKLLLIAPLIFFVSGHNCQAKSLWKKMKSKFTGKSTTPIRKPTTSYLTRDQKKTFDTLSLKQQKSLGDLASFQKEQRQQVKPTLGKKAYQKLKKEQKQEMSGLVTSYKTSSATRKPTSSYLTPGQKETFNTLSHEQQKYLDKMISTQKAERILNKPKLSKDEYREFKGKQDIEIADLILTEKKRNTDFKRDLQEKRGQLRPTSNLPSKTGKIRQQDTLSNRPLWGKQKGVTPGVAQERKIQTPRQISW